MPERQPDPADPEQADAPPGGAPPTGSRVLLLNATFEPLAVVTAKRAVVLMLTGKAECVQAALEGAFHSESLDDRRAVGDAAVPLRPGALPPPRPDDPRRRPAPRRAPLRRTAPAAPTPSITSFPAVAAADTPGRTASPRAGRATRGKRTACSTSWAGPCG